MNEKQQRVIDILADVTKKPAGDLQPSLHLRDDLQLDSAQSLELLSEIEEAFDVEIDEVTAAKVETVQQLLDLVPAA